MASPETLIEGHNTSRHDGGIALFTTEQPNCVTALASERVSRIKHDGRSEIAYDYLKDRLDGHNGIVFGGTGDTFSSEYQKHQPLHHHLAHASSAYFPSGFNDAAVLVVDGQGPYSKEGQYASTSIWLGQENDLKLLEINPEDAFSTQSLGLFYSAISYYSGMGFLQEGKTMGLAPYGSTSELYSVLGKYIHLDKDGTYQIHPKFIEAMFHLSEGKNYFHWENRIPDKETRTLMEELYTQLGPPHRKGEVVGKHEMNLAWAAQNILEKAVLGLAQRAKNLTGSNNLCYAGGVALNSVANGLLQKSEAFNNLFILPAAGDEGQALGRLLYKVHAQNRLPRTYTMQHAYLGPEYTQDEIESAILTNNTKVTAIKYDEDDLINNTAARLANGEIIAWWQEGSEIGPRALGHRSILANPGIDGMRDHINFHVKHREWFRPLAPSVPLEDAPDYFALSGEAPYMLLVADVRPDKEARIAAVSHVDHSARPQTVTEQQNPKYWRLMKRLGKVTGTPVVLNTSFNDSDEPIVETPSNAVSSFLRMNLDGLVLGDYFIQKKV